MERQIRNDKKEIAGLEGILRSNTNNEDLIEETKNKFNLKSYKLKEKEIILNDLVKQTNLKRDISRERIDSTNQRTSQKIVQASKVIERNKEMWYNNTVPLGKQLIFEDNVSKNNYIPKNTTITNVTTIAGNNTKEFRNASLYVKKYGGKISDWEKRAGKAESSKYIFDVHWVQSKNGILTEWKISNIRLKEGE